MESTPPEGLLNLLCPKSLEWMGINKALTMGKVSLYSWPPVWLVWILWNKSNCCSFNLSKAADSKQNKQEVSATMILPLKFVVSGSGVQHILLTNQFKAYVNWQNNLVLTSVATTGLSVKKLDFPAITICAQVNSVWPDGTIKCCSNIPKACPKISHSRFT